jgi:hypothetical protein
MDLLARAQNPKTPVEVLEHILEHPALSPEVLTAILRHPETPGVAMSRLAEHAGGSLLEVLLGSLERLGRWVEVLEALFRNPAVPPERHPGIRRQIELAKRRDTEGVKKSLLQRIKDLPVGQKLALAKKGNKDVRMILIKDPNEMVALEVVTSPRITDGEILTIATMRDVSDKVLRYIGGNRKYRQNRQVVVALLNNPKTPVGMCLGLGIHKLMDRELLELTRNRNIPVAVSRAARQILDRRRMPQPVSGEHR